MDAHNTFATARIGLVAIALTLPLAGCNNGKPAAADDASINSQVQSRLSSDRNLSGQSIQASVANGVVTLSGSVSSDTVRTIASGDAGQVAGVKTVVDNLIVQPPPASVAAVPPSRSVPAPKTRKPSATIAQTEPAPVVRNGPPPAPAQPAPQPAPAPVVTQAAPPAPPPPPTPVVHNITLPAGTAIPVRITQTLDSATTETGDKFTGAIASDIIVDGMVVLPQGTPVTGHVDAAQDAAHFKGSSLLTISLSAINRKGEHIEVATEAYTKQGQGRGTNTAEKVGGGAAIGAILGGIIGHGAGAAIGAAAGAGAGAGVNGVTRGQQVQIPSETVVRFKLSDPIIVHVTTTGGGQENSGPTLERHSDQ
jgi:hypothetical protein